jgi:hypothetical protein
MTRATVHLTLALLASACRESGPRPAPAARDAGLAATRDASLATPDVPHRRFPTLAAAIAAIVPADARVLGIGELHARTDRPDVRPALAAFRDDVLPGLAPRLSDLVLETWIVDKACGARGQAATARVESAMRRPVATQDDLGKTVAAARAGGVQVHAMKMTCADYDAVAPEAGDVDIEKLLGLVTRELGRIAASAVAHRDREGGARPVIAVYGGALHNDRFPYDSVAQWSYAGAIDKVTADRFVELDLYPPELAQAEPLYAKEPWFPLVAVAGPDRVLVFERGVRSWVVILPTTASAAPRTPAPDAAR